MAKQIPLNSRKYPGLFALVDDEDYEYLSQFKWHPNVDKFKRVVYAHATVNRKVLKMHKVVCPDYKIVDHINNDGLDNRKVNLRSVTPSINIANTPKRRYRIPTSSKYKGVYFIKTGNRQKRWSCRIVSNRKQYHLGYFHTEEEAARVYDIAAIQTWGEYANTNFPREEYEGIPVVLNAAEPALRR